MKKLRTKPRNKTAFLSLAPWHLPEISVFLACTIFLFIESFARSQLPAYVPFIALAVTLFYIFVSLFNIRKSNKKAAAFFAAGKDDAFPIVLILQTDKADAKQLFPSAYIGFYSGDLEAIRKFAELEAAAAELPEISAIPLYEKEEQLADDMGETYNGIDQQNFAPIDMCALHRKKILLDHRIYEFYRPIFDWTTVKENQNEIIIFEKYKNS